MDLPTVTMTKKELAIGKAIVLVDKLIIKEIANRTWEHGIVLKLYTARDNLCLQFGYLVSMNNVFY